MKPGMSLDGMRLNRNTLIVISIYFSEALSLTVTRMQCLPCARCRPSIETSIACLRLTSNARMESSEFITSRSCQRTPRRVAGIWISAAMSKPAAVERQCESVGQIHGMANVGWCVRAMCLGSQLMRNVERKARLETAPAKAYPEASAPAWTANRTAFFACASKCQRRLYFLPSKRS